VGREAWQRIFASSFISSQLPFGGTSGVIAVKGHDEGRFHTLEGGQ
jgi:hypothetical protein